MFALSATHARAFDDTQMTRKFEREFQKERQEEMEEEAMRQEEMEEEAMRQEEMEEEYNINEAFDAWNQEDEAEIMAMDSNDSSSTASNTPYMLGIVGAFVGVVALAMFVSHRRRENQLIAENNLIGSSATPIFY